LFVMSLISIRFRYHSPSPYSLTSFIQQIFFEIDEQKYTGLDRLTARDRHLNTIGLCSMYCEMCIFFFQLEREKSPFVNKFVQIMSLKRNVDTLYSI